MIGLPVHAIVRRIRAGPSHAANTTDHARAAHRHRRAALRPGASRGDAGAGAAARPQHAGGRAATACASSWWRRRTSLALLVFSEVFASEAAFAAHRESAHAAWFREARAPYVAEANVRELRPVAPPRLGAVLCSEPTCWPVPAAIWRRLSRGRLRGPLERARVGSSPRPS